MSAPNDSGSVSVYYEECHVVVEFTRSLLYDRPRFNLSLTFLKTGICLCTGTPEGSRMMVDVPEHSKLTVQRCKILRKCQQTYKAANTFGHTTPEHSVLSTQYFTITIIDQMSVTHNPSNDAFSGISALDR